MLKFLVIPAVLIGASALNAGARPLGEPRLCRTVHGRLMITNGTPNVRIWVIGTRHYLSLPEQADEPVRPMPANVQRAWRRASPLTASLYGDFHVCAWKAARPGEMEKVRLIAAHNLVTGPYR